MAKRIAIIQGHPDAAGSHLGHALANAYAEAASQAGHQVEQIVVAALDFPVLRNGDDFWHGSPPPVIAECQRTMSWAEHLVIVYPLWLGDMPALLKAFFEQAFRPGFALSRAEPGKMGHKLLTGKTARIVVTMGMPALLYRLYFRAHSLKSLERNILGFCGIAPAKATLFGMVGSVGDGEYHRWLRTMRNLGRDAG